MSLDAQDGANVLAAVLIEFKRRTGATMAVACARLRVHAVEDNSVLVRRCEGEDGPCPVRVEDAAAPVCKLAGFLFLDVHGLFPSPVEGGNARMAIWGASGANPPSHLALGVGANNSRGFLFDLSNYTDDFVVSKWQKRICVDFSHAILTGSRDGVSP